MIQFYKTRTDECEEVKEEYNMIMGHGNPFKIPLLILLLFFFTIRNRTRVDSVRLLNTALCFEHKWH